MALPKATTEQLNLSECSLVILQTARPWIEIRRPPQRQTGFPDEFLYGFKIDLLE
jgi:hypothetical protein